MDQDLELSEIMQSIAEKSLGLMANFKQEPNQLPTLIHSYIELLTDAQQLALALFKDPERMMLKLITYYQDAMGLLQDQLQHWLKGQAKPIPDKRFSSEEWVNNPFFNLLSQQYLLASEHVSALLEQLDYEDPSLAKRVQFLMRQFLDALSPANFFHTNPQLMAETLETRGKNLLQGLLNLLSDLETDPSRFLIKMTDMNAFKVGDNIAITPGQVIFKNELMELIQYSPQTDSVKSIPLLIIPPWINKYYILDLSPHNSLIRYLVSEGITVFVISWVNPNAAYANKSLSHYLEEGPITAIQTIQQQLGVNAVNAIGFCIGGTLLTMLLAYYKANDLNPIRSATFLAALIDFSDPGDMAVFIDEQQIEKLEARMNAQGYLDGHFMASAFNSLRASDLIWSIFIKHYLRGHSPVPFDLLYWNADSTNMPAKMHSDYLRWMYLHNDLIKPNQIVINEVPLNVHQIDIPTFFVSTQKDHIAPWKTTYLGFQAVQGKKRFILGGSGHIAGIIIPPGSEKYGYYKATSCEATADEWLEKARFQPGSWWPEWLTWLKKESGRLIKAPDIKQLPLQGLVDAPGEYVHVGSQQKAP
jgi:polyhydroxyalkanoate synthase